MQPAYEVEDGLDMDFFAALKNMQPAPEHEHDEPEPACLITNEPLDAFHVVLACKHKFNYEPLYQEVLRQKGRFGMHAYYEKIGTHQIKCPYCRTMTNQLLPFIGSHPTIKRVSGVNSPASMCMPGIACTRCNCNVNAFYEHNSNPYCLRHYNSALKSKPKKTGSKSDVDAAVADAAVADAAVKCAAEIQTGKNKGNQCSLNAIQYGLCKKHSKCNVVLYAS